MMHVQRVQRLITVLQGIDPGKFSLGDWAYKQPLCGTVCCAAGYAALDPELNAQGLRLKAIYSKLGTDEHRNVEDMLKEPPTSEEGIENAWPWFNGDDRLAAHALADFFGFEDGDVERIFYSWSYRKRPNTVTPQDVIDHIREVAAEHGVTL